VTKNSPRFSQASMSIAELLQEVYAFPVSILSDIGKHLPEVQPGDFVAEQVPLFIQQMDTLYIEKGRRLQEANERDDDLVAHKLFNERMLLHAMLTYFASIAAPIEWLNQPFEWEVCKDFVLVYRKRSRKTDDGDDEAPTKPKRILN